MKIFGCKNIINNLCYGQCQVGQCTIMDSAFHHFWLRQELKECYCLSVCAKLV